MTVAELKTKIEARGFVVKAITSNGDTHTLDVETKDGNKVAWPAVMTGKSGAINGVAVKSYHPMKIEGMNEHAVVAVYGDLYAQHSGRPSAADKAVAAMFAKPAEAVQPEQKKEEVPAEAKPVEGAVIEQAKQTGKKSSRHAA